eukprot:gene29320-36493_t
MVFGTHHSAGGAVLQTVQDIMQGKGSYAGLCAATITVADNTNFDAVRSSERVKTACSVFHLLEDPMELILNSYLAVLQTPACNKDGRTADGEPCGGGWANRLANHEHEFKFDERMHALLAPKRRTYAQHLMAVDVPVGLLLEIERLVEFKLKDMVTSYELLLEQPNVPVIQMCARDLEENFEEAARSIARSLNHCGCNVPEEDAPLLFAEVRAAKKRRAEKDS